MILITGGLGFIGLNTAEALLNLGETCVLTQHHTVVRIPNFIDEELDKRIFIEPLDISDTDALLALGRRHKITGIIHLAASNVGLRERSPARLLENLRVNQVGFLNVLQVAHDWGVLRVCVASTIGVYGKVVAPFHEDMLLSMEELHPIPAVKKTQEIISSLFATMSGLQVINLRFATWGRLGRPDSLFISAHRLVHAAVREDSQGLSGGPVYAADGGDMCYVKDCARAIAMVQTAESLSHATYNIGAGRVIRNQEIVDAIKRVIPETRIELLDGHSPHGLTDDLYMDITRIRDDVGFRLEYDVERGVADYIAWLREGNER